MTIEERVEAAQAKYHALLKADPGNAYLAGVCDALTGVLCELTTAWPIGVA